ncbi:hypothetical protein [uncultured Faecalicoccus sp.]|uniref:hypothetical protein n=1 Tax=uncultured Faecalicoccus sp. TaxID=1971760 RepID=UPI002600ACA1|nr:hypothetical protein [uncultured Faecalicoccus sp.]
MPIKQRLVEDDRDELTEDVDDLDAAYIQTLKDLGVDRDLLEQFRDLTLENKTEE